MSADHDAWVESVRLKFGIALDAITSAETRLTPDAVAKATELTEQILVIVGADRRSGDDRRGSKAPA